MLSRLARVSVGNRLYIILWYRRVEDRRLRSVHIYNKVVTVTIPIMGKSGRISTEREHYSWHRDDYTLNFVDRGMITLGRVVTNLRMKVLVNRRMPSTVVTMGTKWKKHITPGYCGSNGTASPIHGITAWVGRPNESIIRGHKPLRRHSRIPNSLFEHWQNVAHTKRQHHIRNVTVRSPFVVRW